MSNRKIRPNVSEVVGGIDSLKREIPIESGPTRKNGEKYVGLFYFLWNGEHGDVPRLQVKNITEILKQDPKAGYKPESPIWGKEPVIYYWGEPIFGYYLSRDRWVMRKHVEMLARAGVDFLAFDATNAFDYYENATALMKILHEAKLDGWKVPGVAYYTNAYAGTVAQRLYETIYQKNLFSDTWFRVEGKPLFITVESECSEEIRNFFYIRETQWPTLEDRENGFPWISFQREQKVYADKSGKYRVMSVSPAQHPQLLMGNSALYGMPGNWGRSFHDGYSDHSENSTLYGYNFQEQWDHALKKDPDIVFVTGWNEWTMSRFKGEPEHPVMFVDNADEEFSRDLEPMKGGHSDNYYMQLICNIRRFKGSNHPKNHLADHPIDIRGDFAQWQSVRERYENFDTRCRKRDEPGFGGTRNVNDTCQNVMRFVKVAQDEDALFFYVKTRNKLVPYKKGSEWLRFYLRTDSEEYGWNGYQYLLNYEPVSQAISTVARYEKDKWVVIGRVPYKTGPYEAMFALPKSLLGLKSGFTIQFKCADASTSITCADDFYCNGCCLPIGRLNYVFQSHRSNTKKAPL